MTARTLVISPNWIGDAIMAQPLLRLLKERDPEQAIDVLAPVSVAPVWRAMEEVDKVMVTPFQHGSLQLLERWRFARKLRVHAYQQAYVLPNTWKFALIPWLAGIKKRIGYRGEMRYGLLNVMHHDVKVRRGSNTPRRPMVSFYAALAAPPTKHVALPSVFPRPALRVTPDQITSVLPYLGLAADHPVIVLAPGAEFGPAKRWPGEHFAQLAQAVLQAWPKVQIVLLGTKKDHAFCQKIADALPVVHNLAGHTTLTDAMALVAYADVVVSNDSGLLHVASALNRPVIALYGPTAPDHAPPFSDVKKSLSLRLDCAPCRQRVCPLGHHACMRNLVPDMVWRELQTMIKTVHDMDDDYTYAHFGPHSRSYFYPTLMKEKV